ncbi:WD40-repeat-containing domain protein [Coemansia spiralis]|nr:WD40-repeat-containing domain protein [Coemansia spiralis]
MEGETTVNREEIIRLVICQLSAYGYSSLSQAIATHTKVPMTAESNSRLEELVVLAAREGDTDTRSVGEYAERSADRDTADEAGNGIDLGKADHILAEVPQLKVWYKTKHKGVATAAVFSKDGKYIATGSADASLKLIEVDRVRNPAAGSARREDKPVIRTLYHHEAEVTGLAFHPNGLVLASCSADHTIKLFDLSAAYGKHSFQSFKDNYAYRSIAFHPSGDYLVAGSDACEVRLYNVRTGKAYLLAAGDGADLERHSDGITQVCYSANGALIGSSSRDGTIKIWDGVSGKCIRTISEAHEGRAVTAVRFSRNSKYVLSTGLDSCVRLWEVSNGNLAKTYNGAALDSLNAQAVFSRDEALVMVPDCKANVIVSWDTVTGDLLAQSADHKQRITWVAASPTAPALMTCSVDECVRFWCADTA